MAKQSGGNTAQRVEALVRPVVEGMGLRLWDVVFEKEGPDWYLRVLIDKDGTMDTDTCAEVSHALGPGTDRRISPKCPTRWTPSSMRQTPSTRAIISRWAAPVLAAS